MILHDTPAPKAEKTAILAAVQGAELVNAVAKLTDIYARLYDMPMSGEAERDLVIRARGAIWEAIEAVREVEKDLTEHHGIHLMDAAEQISLAPRLTAEQIEKIHMVFS